MDANLDSRFNTQDQSKIINATIEMNRLHDLPVQLVRVRQRIDRFDEIFKKLDDPALGTVAKLSLIDSVSLDAELHVGQVVGQSGTASSQPAASEATDDDLNPGATDGGQAIVEPAVVGPPEWQVLDREERRIQGEVADASRIYLPGNKKMVALNTELKSVQSNLELDYLSARNRMELQRQSLIDEEQDLEKSCPSTRRSITSTPSCSRTASSIRRARSPTRTSIPTRKSTSTSWITRRTRSGSTSGTWGSSI